MESHIKEHPAWFKRFEVSWTPTVLVLDSGGKERYRIEGYLPPQEFRAQLESALARLAFDEKKWKEAEDGYRAVAQQYAQTSAAAEAEYWAGVSQYQASHDPAALGKTAQTLKQKYPNSVWAEKASIWLG